MALTPALASCPVTELFELVNKLGLLEVMAKLEGEFQRLDASRNRVTRENPAVSSDIQPLEKVTAGPWPFPVQA